MSNNSINLKKMGKSVVNLSKTGFNPIVNDLGNLKHFLDEMGHVKYKVTEVEERALMEEYQTADEERKAQIREKLVEANQLFVYAVAKRFRQDERIADLVQVGNIGLLEAFDAYDITSGNRFMTCAVWYIRRAIVNFIRDDKLVIPTNNTKTFGKLNKIRDRFYALNGYEATDEQVLEIFNEENPNSKLKKASDVTEICVNRISNVRSEDGDDYSDEFMYHATGELYGDAAVENEYCQKMEDEDRKYLVSALLKCLNPTEQEIVKMSFGLNEDEKPMTNKDIAEVIGKSAEYVRLALIRCMDKMREHAAYIKR